MEEILDTVKNRREAYHNDIIHYNKIIRNAERYAGQYVKDYGNLDGFAAEDFIKLEEYDIEVFIASRPEDIYLFRTRTNRIVDICIYLSLHYNEGVSDIKKMICNCQITSAQVGKRINRMKLFQL